MLATILHACMHVVLPQLSLLKAELAHQHLINCGIQFTHSMNMDNAKIKPGAQINGVHSPQSLQGIALVMWCRLWAWIWLWQMAHLGCSLPAAHLHIYGELCR